jgi:DNA-binding CsgD family transcriptional regulator
MVTSRRWTAESALPLWIVDSGQHLLYMNESARDLLGVQNGRAIEGRRCYDVVAARRPDGIPFCARDCPVMQAVKRDEDPQPVRSLLDRQNGDGTGAGEQPRVSCRMFHITLRPPAGEGDFQVLHVAWDLTRFDAVADFSERVLGATRALVGGAMGGNPLDKLTRQERRILALLAQGSDTGAIAEELQLSEATVRNHTQHILSKLGCHSRLQAVVLVQPYLAMESLVSQDWDVIDV